MNSISILLLGIVTTFNGYTLIGVLGNNSSDSENSSSDPQNSFPYHVTIIKASPGPGPGPTTCGGSILSEQWIITLMDCVSADEFTVEFLSNNQMNSPESFTITLDATSVVPNPSPKFSSALIKLPVMLVFSKNLGAIAYKLPSADKNLDNKMAVLPGLSMMQPTGLSPQFYTIVPEKTCEEKLFIFYDNSSTLCANPRDEMTSSSGQSKGSGLAINWPKKPILVGLFGFPMNELWGIPALLEKIYEYEDWIEKTMAGENQN